MFNKLRPVWLVAGRELKDQFRDWRVLTPMIILMVCFPFLMNEFAKQTVDFLNQYEANLILDRLVPFSIMIIGFFPITISLVVALEAFVGEKERGTIEPVLSAPLDDWQLYFGKLLVGVATPLAASYLSITLYLIMIVQQGLEIPSFSIMLQLILLTTAHATLMVSAAIVISVQSTSVKAANLLASFIVIPVAILMQGEAVMLFWGNEDVLWLAVAGVMIIALLLIRVGIAHFQREYLLGREIDTINLKWVLNTFWKNFMGGAHSIGEWYRKVLGGAMRRVLPAVLAVTLVAGVSLWMGYDWIMVNVSPVIAKASPERLEKIEESAREMPGLANLQDTINAPFLFMNNTRAVALIFLAGLVSFSVLGVLLYMLNIGLIGGVYALLELLGLQPLPIFLAGVLPHGIFELPALVIGAAVVLYMGVAIVTPQTGKSMGEVIIELFADWTKIFFGLVVPLLAVAAVIEAYITPVLLAGVVK
ncbi:MAG: stage II sporulation protein M [Anaerolineales bacterium]|uniref:stage II sporulation protein M n=1 Tax=Candidatus Villigracilis affinis TaxID=3140682 RepID=UPI001B4D9230|nr:stage II sporulation protein M [Anaerolineales bacterium]MBK9603386.1 stage II sporulation protein M [Anaerolineales bacterium]MBP8047195.1 stage II sporulation protein M [Anaerolineales bacterium]